MEDKEEKFNKHLEGRESDYREKVYITSLRSIKTFYRKWNKTEQEICIDCIVYDKTNVEIKNLKAQYDDMIKQNIKKDKEIAELKELKEKMLIMDKNFDQLNKDMDDKEKQIDDMSKTIKEMYDLLKRKFTLDP